VKDGEAFLSALERCSRLLAPRARATFEANRELCSWLLDPLARWASAAYGEKVFEQAARGYARYCLGVARAQMTYESAGRYTPQAQPEILCGVYEDEGYMVPYMWAAILIYAFWPSMVGHLALLREEFLRRLPAQAAVLELACGHGALSLLVAEERPDVRVTALDISAPAIAVARRLCAASGHLGRVRFVVADVLRHDATEELVASGAGGGGRYQGIIAAMLAEHLPAPHTLLAAIAGQLAPDGLAFVSAALESAQRDHVFELHRESELLALAEAAGLRASRLLSDASAVGPGSRFLPRAAAMILRAR
jgi:2-polyprenyl-3-methyl-5-hydroxy-6-metoxy-1,4-benzoquinol methylase